MPRDVGDSIRGLWSDPAVKEAVKRSREFQLNDSAVYYFNSIDRMSGPVCARVPVLSNGCLNVIWICF